MILNFILWFFEEVLFGKTAKNNNKPLPSQRRRGR